MRLAHASAPRASATRSVRLLCLAAALLIGAPAGAATLRVPSEYPTIQSAVDAAGSVDDSVLIAAGTYQESVIVAGKCVTLIGEAGPASTTVTGLTWTTDSQSATNSWSAIQGLTILSSTTIHGLRNNFSLSGNDFQSHVEAVADWRNANMGILVTGCTFHGGAFLGGSDWTACYVYVSACTFQNGELQVNPPGVRVLDSVFSDAAINVSWCEEVTVSGNHLTGAASSLSVFSSLHGISVDQNTLTDAGGILLRANLNTNSCTDNTLIRSGGISCVGGSSRWLITSNRIERGSAGISVDAEGYEDNVTGNALWRCAAGVYFGTSTHGPIAEGNSIVECSSAGIRVKSTSGAPELHRNLVVRNHPGIVINNSTAVLECNDSWANAGGNWVGVTDPTGVNGNISADPFFCDPENGGLGLASNSPCLPGHHPQGDDCGLIGAYGQACGTSTAVAEMPLAHSTWGVVKQQFAEPGSR